MRTRLKLGPANHGRPLTWDEYIEGDYEGGYKYELVDGRLYVSALPNPPEDFLENWLYDLVKQYIQAHPEVVNHATNKARVFVEGREDITAVEPDIAAYHGFPRARALRGLKWDEVSPVLVVEILSPNHPEKDLERNVELYLGVRSIREYWIVDGRPNPAQPRLVVCRRVGRRWKEIEVPFGETYSTKLLPGFELVVDPLAKEPEA
jgi:Uma2 family endonuclease